MIERVVKKVLAKAIPTITLAKKPPRHGIAPSGEVSFKVIKNEKTSD